MTHTLDLDPSDDTLRSLANDYTHRIQEAVDGQYMSRRDRDQFADSLGQWLDQQPVVRECLEAARRSADERCLFIRSLNPGWLNLPWRLALPDLPHLHIAGLPITEHEPETYPPTTPLPLRILVMISAPIDEKAGPQLDYESEERQIIRAMSPLIEEGLVQIDFTEDGSLEALKNKLASYPYHALHFSGHGTYQNGKGMLELEEYRTLRSLKTDARDFATALTQAESNTPPLVVLAACKTAEGGSEAGQTGLASALIQKGVPSVIAMSERIFDDFATIFASCLYERMATEAPLPEAFTSACKAIRGREEQEYRRDPNQEASYQWLIPQLLLSKSVGQLVDFNSARENIQLRGRAFQLTAAGLELIETDRPFVGRRKERSRLLKALYDGKPVLIRGMGGVGKSALAAQLLDAIRQREPSLEEVIFNEAAGSLHHFFSRIDSILAGQAEERSIQPELETAKETAQQLQMRLNKLQKVRKKIVFVFDNLETFQKGPGQPFEEAHAEWEEVIQTLAANPDFPLILTARYPIPGIPGLHEEPLNQSGLNDFWKKSLYTELYPAYLRLKEAQKQHIELTMDLHAAPTTYLTFVENLYRALGGNYRLLEYFDGIIAAQPGRLAAGLQSLKELEAELHKARESIEASERNHPLIFRQLIGWLSEAERNTLVLLACFRIPVAEIALNMQIEGADLHLESLWHMTLIERHEGPGGSPLWYATPLVKDFLLANDFQQPNFSHEKAGNYYHKIVPENLLMTGIEQQEEAFHHYVLSHNRGRVALIGEKLTDAYFGKSLFRKALEYGTQTEEIAGEEISVEMRNGMGQLWRFFGEYDKAQNYFERALAAIPEATNLAGSILAGINIGGIALVKREYERALERFHSALIYAMQTIEHRHFLGDILGNIAHVHSYRGEYKEALAYFNKALEEAKFAGNKADVSARLHNIAIVLFAQGKYEEALILLKTSLDIAREVGDKYGEAKTLAAIGNHSLHFGRPDLALKILEDSLVSAKELGEPSGIAATLKTISFVYANQGEYSIAGDYLKKGLLIAQNIKDQSLECRIIKDIGYIHFQKGDFHQALESLNHALSIALGIGEKGTARDIYGKLGDIYTRRGNFSEAEKYFRLSR